MFPFVVYTTLEDKIPVHTSSWELIPSEWVLSNVLSRDKQCEDGDGSNSMSGHFVTIRVDFRTDSSSSPQGKNFRIVKISDELEAHSLSTLSLYNGGLELDDSGFHPLLHFKFYCQRAGQGLLPEEYYDNYNVSDEGKDERLLEQVFSRWLNFLYPRLYKLMGDWSNLLPCFQWLWKQAFQDRCSQAELSSKGIVLSNCLWILVTLLFAYYDRDWSLVKDLLKSDYKAIGGQPRVKLPFYEEEATQLLKQEQLLPEDDQLPVEDSFDNGLADLFLTLLDPFSFIDWYLNSLMVRRSIPLEKKYAAPPSKAAGLADDPFGNPLISAIFSNRQLEPLFLNPENMAAVNQLLQLPLFEPDVDPLQREIAFSEYRILLAEHPFLQTVLDEITNLVRNGIPAPE